MLHSVTHLRKDVTMAGKNAEDCRGKKILPHQPYPPGKAASIAQIEAEAQELRRPGLVVR